MRRVVVVGTSAVGKTTFARRLAAILGVPHVELDALHWEPGWQAADPAVFRARVRAAVEATEAWVVDGGYSPVRPIVWGRADTVVWLDYPLPTILLRLSRRTLARVISREEIWNGNRERWRTAFASRESLYWWVLTTHRGRSRRITVALDSLEYRHIRAVRFRSPRRAERWLQELEASSATQALGRW